MTAFWLRSDRSSQQLRVDHDEGDVSHPEAAVVLAKEVAVALNVMRMHIMIAGDVVEGSIKPFQDRFGLLPVLRIFTDVAGEDDHLWMPGINHRNRLLQIFRGVRRSRFADVSIT